MEITNYNHQPPKISSWDWLRRIPKEDLPMIAEIISCYTDDLQPYLYIFGKYRWGRVLEHPKVEKLIYYAKKNLKPGEGFREFGNYMLIKANKWITPTTPQEDILSRYILHLKDFKLTNPYETREKWYEKSEYDNL